MGLVLPTTKQLIRRFEGLRLKPYLCPAGIWTVGYGHTPWSPERGAISVDQAEALLDLDAQKAAEGALRYCPALEHEMDRLAALTDFVFNLGAGRLQASTLRRKVNAGDWDAAKVEINKWVFAKGRKLPGLVLRRAAEAALL